MITAVLVVFVIVGLSGVAGALPLWVRRYNGPGNGVDTARRVVVSPNGTMIYVTGSSVGSTSGSDYETLAYNATTGAVVWFKRYNALANHDDFANAMAVSPDGSMVYVTGESQGSTSDYDYATVAYNATTGAVVWAKRYNGPANNFDRATAITVSPDSTRVYVTGSSFSSVASDYATLAYSAATGAVVWTKRYNDPYNASDAATAVAASPDGTKVYVTGSTTIPNSDYGTVAYNATTGAVVWFSRYNGPANHDDYANAMAVSPDGTKVYVTGESRGSTIPDYPFDSETVAYNATTGAAIWFKRYNGPTNGDDGTDAVAVSPDGTKVYVTGHSIVARTGCTCDDYLTLAYNATTGTAIWFNRYNGPANGSDDASAVAVSPDGTKVYVTGQSSQSSGAITTNDYATLAYNATTGAVAWTQRYNGPGNGNDSAGAVVVSPDSTKVYVTGSSVGSTSKSDYATIAYGSG